MKSAMYTSRGAFRVPSRIAPGQRVKGRKNGGVRKTGRIVSEAVMVPTVNVPQVQCEWRVVGGR